MHENDFCWPFLFVLKKIQLQTSNEYIIIHNFLKIIVIIKIKSYYGITIPVNNFVPMARTILVEHRTIITIKERLKYFIISSFLRFGTKYFQNGKIIDAEKELKKRLI